MFDFEQFISTKGTILFFGTKGPDQKTADWPNIARLPSNEDKFYFSLYLPIEKPGDFRKSISRYLHPKI